MIDHRYSHISSFTPSIYSTCITCTRSLGANEVIETLPIGRRLAFDAAQGRLWVVCQSCGKWNLVPFDTRLESIDHCEQLFRDTKTRYSTDNIGMARVPEGLELVRIGPALRSEFASWRYGAMYRIRRRTTMLTAGVGGIVGLGVWFGVMGFARAEGWAISGMVGGGAQWVARAGYHLVRNRRRRVITRIEGQEDPLVLGKSRLESSRLLFTDSGMALQFGPDMGRQFLVPGAAGRLLARRVTASLNDVVGSKEHVEHAVRRMSSDNMSDWLLTKGEASLGLIVTEHRRRRGWEKVEQEVPAVNLKSLEPTDRLAVEMWLSEEDEARALSGELALLERQWREAEELAKIADDLVTEPDDSASPAS